MKRFNPNSIGKIDLKDNVLIVSYNYFFKGAKMQTEITVAILTILLIIAMALNMASKEIESGKL